MKKIFLSLVALMVATVSFAQALVATLSHGDDIKFFYGTRAFQQAMDAAKDGDVINLSSGDFTISEINKAVTIRGVGYMEEKPTKIRNVSINIPTNVTERLIMEGLFMDGTSRLCSIPANSLFIKNYIHDFYNDSNLNYVMLVNCDIERCLYSRRNKTTMQFINSYVKGFNNSAGGAGIEFNEAAGFVNCVLDHPSYLRGCSLLNCILSDPYGLDSSTFADNCLGVGNISFNEISGSNNKKTDNSIFISGLKSDLTDEAKANYLGTDSTPVGMYGGPVPFSVIPSYPRITKMNVAGKTTADGKLSVEIEVSAAQ